MENNGDAGVIVRTEEPLDEGQREQFLAALRERKRGIGVADRPLLLWGGAEIVRPRRRLPIGICSAIGNSRWRRFARRLACRRK